MMSGLAERTFSTMELKSFRSFGKVSSPTILMPISSYFLAQMSRTDL